ncbi:hypothetical protein [Vibrio cyclitrophicus]|uniref:hypothetical protein n=1 Tax=Vibrio cyclitrophicus TaxID=47951 RepID=UPI00142E1564|nr:hypothetical protein [Vibrio cyclitrophicus]
MRFEGDTLTVNGTEIELTAAHITAGEVLTDSRCTGGRRDVNSRSDHYRCGG